LLVQLPQYFDNSIIISDNLLAKIKPGKSYITLIVSIIDRYYWSITCRAGRIHHSRIAGQEEEYKMGFNPTKGLNPSL
jgi:hypothetical protein